MAAPLSLVTGGNGFVGCHVVRALLERGERVRVLVRQGASLKALAGLACETVVGDLREPCAVERAVAGCTRVYHVAADYRLWVPQPAPMYATNVEGTKNVLEAARRAGVERVVYTSTVGTLGFDADGIGREDAPVSLHEMTGTYKRSKFIAEQLAVNAAREGLPVVVVNPSTPIGAFDYKPTPTGRIILDFLKGKMTAYLDTGLNLADVEDVARGHLLAADRGRVGEKYILGGENLTLKELFERLALLSGIPAPKFKVPYSAAYAFALAAEAWARAVSKQPPRASLTEVRMARRRMFFDSSKARSQLGYEPTPINSALAKAIAFYRRCGMV
jgi:dihydroflavonol-4-reductase